MRSPRRAGACAAILATVSLCALLWSPAAGAQDDPGQHVRIVNGTQAPAGAFGFVVSILDAKAFANHGPYESQFCAGTLTTPTTVVTAAHCVMDRFTGQVLHPGSILVGFGQTLNESEVQTEPVARIEVHPGYDPTTVARDVAVLTLAQAQPDMPTLTPLRPTDDGAYEAAGQRGVIVGWGMTSIEEDLFPVSVHAASVVIFPPESCGGGETYEVAGTPFEGFHAGQADSTVMLCAAGTTANGRVIDSCQGDSGGPLIVGNGLAARLVGIVSWGEDCASSLPGVYTRTSAVTDFLLQGNAIITLAPLNAPEVQVTALHESLRVSFAHARDGSAASVFAATATDPGTSEVRTCYVKPRSDELPSSCQIKGLTNGTPYLVSGISANTAGNSPPAPAIEVAPVPVPVPGRILHAQTHDGGRADFTVSRSRSEGPALQALRVVCLPIAGGPGLSARISGDRAEVTGLQPAAYACSVSARNAIGTALGDAVLIKGRN